MIITIRFFTTDQTIIEYNIDSPYMETALQTAICKYNDEEPYGKLKKVEAFPNFPKKA